MGLTTQNNSNYTAESVKTLEGLTPFRHSPGMYIGATNEYGLFHIAKEIVNNSVDEALNGDCNKIVITLLKDGGISIEDNGRGFPHGMQDETFSILGACFGKEHTGGKFLNDGESGYNSSGGMHGIGCKCAAALGIKTIAYSYRDGIEEMVEFSQGKLLKQITDGKCDKKKHGTLVIWYPDSEIFTETVKFDRNKIEKELCQEYSFLNSGLTFVLKDETTNYEKTYYSEHGIEDYLDFLNNGKDYLLQPICLSAEEGNFSVEVGIAYNTNYSPSIKLYTNSVPQTRGTHLTGFKTAWTSAINKFARENKWLKDKDENLTGEDLSEGQILIINFKMINPIFEGQVKENLTSAEGRTYTQKLVSGCIYDYLNMHKDEIKEVVLKGLGARKAREAAKKAREATRGVNKKDKKKQLLNLPSKLVDCWCKDRLKCELFIAEGDSAASGLVEGRDAEIHAVFPIRGKIISAYKNKPEKIFANEEVINLIKAIGLDLDSKTQKLIYDKTKLRYGKILLAADADPDGASIRNLLIEMFWWLCPELILNGHIYTTMPPLFRITTNKNKYIYLKDANALDEYKKSHQGEKYQINRNKGLGEQDSDELSEALLNPETRNVAQIIVEDKDKAARLIDILLGTSVPPRREFLLAHEEEANESD